MKTNVILPLLCALSANVAFAANDSTSWGYTGDTGPEHWGQLSDEYLNCQYGKNQSPVNLTRFIESELTPIKINYVSNAYNVVHNGHTIQVNFESGSNISLNNHVFELKQVHFHNPSENHINGKSFPLEAHFVHADTDGNLAVIAVMLEQGKKNSAIAPIWSLMPKTANTEKEVKRSWTGLDLLPKKTAYYRFNGSLTTPPCTEGVTWLVMKESVSISKAQIKAFAKAVGHHNNRPIQPINARPLLK